MITESNRKFFKFQQWIFSNIFQLTVAQGTIRARLSQFLNAVIMETFLTGLAIVEILIILVHLTETNQTLVIGSFLFLFQSMLKSFM